MNSVQERLAKLGMSVDGTGLTKEQRGRTSSGQAIYTGAALPKAPNISLTSELGKLNATEASGGGSGTGQQYRSMDAVLGSPDINFDRETPLEASNSDPVKALEGEDEMKSINDVVPNKFTKEQDADYNVKLSQIANMKSEISKLENDYGLSGAYNKANPGEIEGAKKNLADLEKDAYKMKYDKNYDFTKNSVDNINGINTSINSEATPAAVNTFNNMNNYMKGNFNEAEETVPKVTGDDKYDTENFNASKSYVKNPLAFEGPKHYMKKKGIEEINDPTKTILLAFEGVTGDTTKKAPTKAYGLTDSTYNSLKKEFPKKTDEELFDVEYNRKRSEARRVHDKKFGTGSFDKLEPIAKSVIQLSTYRGDYKSSYDWVKYIQNGQYKKAAKEILIHGNAINSKKNKQAGVLKRFYTYYRLLNSIPEAKPLI